MAEIKISIRAARVNAGLTQAQAAKALHRNRQAVVDWENGTRDLPDEDLRSMEDVYGIPMENLRIRDDEIPWWKEN